MPGASELEIDPSRVRAAVFDLGGVLIEGGPGEVRRFGNSIGIDEEAWERLRRQLFGNESSWAALERGEISLDAFTQELRAGVARAGVEITDQQARSFMGSDRPMSDASRLRTGLLEAITELKQHVPLAMLTNNIREWRQGWRGTAELTGLFDVIVDSSEVGTRKPEPAIYEITRGRLGVDHEDIFFVDDIGQNLKAARALGWQTFLFREEGALVKTLELISNRRAA